MLFSRLLAMGKDSRVLSGQRPIKDVARTAVSYKNGKDCLKVSDVCMQKTSVSPWHTPTESVAECICWEKHTFRRTCLISNTCDRLTSTSCLPAVCSAEVTRVHPMICSPRVSSCRASGRKWVRFQFCIARREIPKNKEAISGSRSNQ